MSRVDLSKVERLVFICLGNICRSPFAEEIARKSGIPAVGFGLSTTTGAPAFELGQQTARKFDIDLTSHCATDWKDFELKDSDLLLTMEIRHAKRVKQLIGDSKAQIALLGHWAQPKRLHIHDPHQHDEIYFTNCYQVLSTATEHLVSQYKSIKGQSS